MKSALFLAAAASASAAERPTFKPWRGMAGLGPQAHVRGGPEGRRLHAHEFEHHHPELGTTSLTYTADVAEHVVFLDEELTVESINCGLDFIELRTSDGGEAVRQWPADAFLVGGPQWECYSAYVEETGHPAPEGHVIFRHVDAVTSVDDAGVVRMETTNGHFAHAFQSMKANFKWAPPHHDEPDPFVAHQKRHAIREMVASREQSRRLEAIEADGRARGLDESEIARRLDLDEQLEVCLEATDYDITGDFTTTCALDMSDVFDFYSDLFSYNYDLETKSPEEELLTVFDDTVYCEDCMAAFNAIFEVDIDVDNLDLKSMLVTATGTVRATATIIVKDPVAMAEEYLERAIEDLDLGGCASSWSFLIGYVPVVIRPCWDLRMEAETSAPVSTTIRTGFLFDASATIGLQYSEADSWQPVKDFSWEYQYAQPYFETDVDMDVSMRFYFVPAISFVLYELIPLEILPKPYVGIDFQQQDAEIVVQDSASDGTWRLEMLTVDSEDQGILGDDRDLVFTLTMNACGDPAAGDSTLYDTSLCTAVSPEFTDVDSLETVDYVFDLAGLRMLDFEALLDTGFSISIDDYSEITGNFEEHIGDVTYAGCDFTQFSSCIESFSDNDVDLVFNISWVHDLVTSDAPKMFTDLFTSDDCAGKFIETRRLEALTMPKSGFRPVRALEEVERAHRAMLLRHEKQALVSQPAPGRRLDDRRLSDACPAIVKLNYGALVEAAIGEIELRMFDSGFLSDYVMSAISDLGERKTLGSFVAVPTTDLTCLMCEGCTTVLEAATAELASTLLPDELQSEEQSDPSMSADNIAALVLLPLSTAALFAMGVAFADKFASGPATSPSSKLAGASSSSSPSCTGCLPSLPAMSMPKRPTFKRRAPGQNQAQAKDFATTNPWGGVTLKKTGRDVPSV